MLYSSIPVGGRRQLIACKYATLNPLRADGYDGLFFIYGSPKAVGAENNSPPEQQVAQSLSMSLRSSVRLWTYS